MRVDFLHAVLGARGRRVATALGSIAIVVLFGMALPATWDYIGFMQVERTSYLKIRFDHLFSIYLAFAVAVIARHLWTLWRIWRPGRPAPAPGAQG